MTAATLELKTEKTVKTGNIVLDMEIPLLSDKQLEKLADYAKYLRWSSKDDDDDNLPKNSSSHGQAKNSMDME